MDYRLLAKVIEELQQQLCPARISKIYQPDPDILILKLWNGQGHHNLLISAEGGGSRIHLTGREWLNPSRPPRFCQLLRARISKILNISLQPHDRIVVVTCSGSSGDCRLMVELTGNNSNLILVDKNDKIIDALKRQASEEGKRTIVAGHPYVYPEKTSYEEKGSEPLEFQSIPFSQYAENLHEERAVKNSRQSIHEQMLKCIVRQKKKLIRRMKHIEADRQKQEDPEHLKIAGELILANLHRIHRGMPEITVQNYYHDPPAEDVIFLEPSLDPQENAQRYFNKYKKFRRGREHTERRLMETLEEQSWLDSLEYQLRDGVGKTEIEDIAEELREAGLLKNSNNLNTRRTTPPTKPRQTVSPSGYVIYWGRNNRQNDDLSVRMMKSGDLWFHTHNIPGAHVVLKLGSQEKNVPETDLVYAAGIAAGYSKARNDTKVEVMYTTSKCIKKAPGAKPGQVLVDRYQTLVVKPIRVD